MDEETYEPEAALETLLYIADRLDTPTVHELLKIVYFADKLHLGEFGWMSSGDDYVAMEFGPVASTTYNMLKAARGERSRWIHPQLVELVAGTISIKNDRKSVEIHRKPNMEWLSAAEVECLDRAIEEYGNMPFDKRTHISHDDAWKEAYNAARDGEMLVAPMSLEAIAKTLPNADEVLAHINS